MHRFLKAIGFSGIQKRDLELILNEVVEHPDSMKVTRDSEEREFAEFTKDFAKNVGITVRGFYDEDDVFHIEYYFPYAKTRPAGRVFQSLLLRQIGGDDPLHGLDTHLDGAGGILGHLHEQARLFPLLVPDSVEAAAAADI